MFQNTYFNILSTKVQNKNLFFTMLLNKITTVAMHFLNT